MANDLYNTPPEELDAFVAQELQPDRAWRKELKHVFLRMKEFFQKECFKDYSIQGKEVEVIKVVKGGSFSKGTDLKHTSDMDMLLFLSCFSSYKDQYKFRGDIIEFMKEKLENCQESKAHGITNISEQNSTKGPPRSLNFDVQSERGAEQIHMSVLPVFNALGERNPLSSEFTVHHEVYAKLKKSRSYPGEFTPSFSELQRNFLKHHPTKVKSLLRLVKHWYRKYVREKYPRRYLPPEYSLELLTIYAWETGTQKAENFSLAKGLVTVMKLLKDYNKIFIYWTNYYKLKGPIKHFVKMHMKESRPFILDPADPTNNVGKGSRWKPVAKEASNCLNQPCSQISSWKIKGARNICVTLKCSSLWELEYSVNPYDPIQNIKKEIERVKNIPITDQQLSFQEAKRKTKVLMGDSTLAEYKVFHPIKIQVLVATSTKCRIHVRFPDNFCRSYLLQRNDNILSVKQKIRKQEGSRVMDQVLRFKGQFLWDKKRLRYFDIKNGDTLELELITRKQKKKLKTKKEKKMLKGKMGPLP
ncbi:2'-5'-oligoadenylate synthase-like protein 2 isoform X1 [Macrotis lagotis]|uniref:2'-5'-oligoadenylate synthase-like protein 2 isoform X1 n=1 Tax=Macrotis lagotis TaxID=92651 RepID=UPI003D69553F